MFVQSKAPLDSVDNFSKAASSYNKNATAQRESAKTLFDLIEELYPSVKSFIDQNILDLGSGTSFLGKEFLLRFGTNPKLRYYELDLSKQMLLNWQERPEGFSPICANLDYFLPFRSESINLIISSFAIQWVQNLKSFFEKVFSLLNNEGRFIFAIPTLDSLKELVEAGFFIRDFPSHLQIKSAFTLAGFKSDFESSRIFFQGFDNSYFAAKSIKLIGANCANRSKQIFLARKKIFDDSPIKLSWNVSFFVIRKNGF